MGTSLNTAAKLISDFVYGTKKTYLATELPVEICAGYFQFAGAIGLLLQSIIL